MARAALGAIARALRALWISCLCASLLAAGADGALAVDGGAAVGEAPILSAGIVEYRPGRGLRIEPIGLVIGGFTNLKTETASASGAEFSLDQLNVFLIFDRFTRFRAVAELQLKDIITATGDAAGAYDFAFDVRRLFGDFTLTDWLRLRAGTFLTPVGYWNLILAPPLTWTTEAPLIVEETFFQPTTTGAMLYGSAGLWNGQLGYSVFSQFLQPLADDSDLDPPDHSAGARLTYDRGPGWSLGATYQGAEHAGEWSQLGALDALWEHRRGQVLAEAYVQGGQTLPSLQWGTYVQGVLEVYGPLFAVGRYEYYDPRSPGPSVNVFTFGAVLRPLPFIAVKVEYRFADRDFEEESLDGFFSSFTTFF